MNLLISWLTAFVRELSNITIFLEIMYHLKSIFKSKILDLSLYVLTFFWTENLPTFVNELLIPLINILYLNSLKKAFQTYVNNIHVNIFEVASPFDDNILDIFNEILFNFYFISFSYYLYSSLACVENRLLVYYKR